MQWIDWNSFADAMPDPWLLIAAALIGWLAAFPLARIARQLPQALFESWAQAEDIEEALSENREQSTPCQALHGWRFMAFAMGPVAIAALALLQHGLQLETVAICVLGWTLWVLAWIDVETRLLPDVLTLGLLWLGLLVNCAELFASLDHAVIGAAAGYSSLWLLNAGYRIWRGHDGMGAGDFKLLAAVGAWLGLTALPAVVLIAAASGVFTGLSLSLIGWRKPGETIAFGPHLCLGAALMVFAEDRLRPLLFP